MILARRKTGFVVLVVAIVDMPHLSCHPDLRLAYPPIAHSCILQAMYLSKLNHPNILKIRGWAGGPSAYREGTHDGFFLILDRIDETLSHRIMRWIMAERKVSPTSHRKIGGVKKIDSKNDFTPYGEKLKIAGQIARGLDYL